MSAELNPCPFCGSKLTEEIPGSGWYTHADFDCVLSGFQFDIAGGFNQAAAWNRRTQPAEEVQPVADERAEYERMLRAGYQHDNVRRQERGLALSDELTQEQEREITERVALKFPSNSVPRKDSPVAFSCAKRAEHPTSWSMTCDKHCGDDAKCLRAALCPPAEEVQPVGDAVRDSIAENLRGVYVCGRVWAAWSYGTMSQEDFSPAWEDDAVIQNIAEGVMAALAAFKEQS